MNWNDNFDTKRFIEEVHKRPCLWDNTSSEYADRVLRMQTWEQLVDIFKENDEELDGLEREREVDVLQKRWKSLRGCFTRELQRQRSRMGSYKPRKSEYIHFKRLQFLLNVVTQKEGDPLAIPADSEDSLPDRQTKRRRKMQPQQKAMTHTFIEAETQPTESKVKCECSKQDEDRLFMLSLVNTLKRVPQNKKIATKIKIMSILNEATSISPKHHPTSPESPYMIKFEDTNSIIQE